MRKQTTRAILAALLATVAVGGGCGGSDDGGGTDDGGSTNVAPVASAGPDQSVATEAVVTLDGSGSSDADGDALTYAWTLKSKPGGSVVSLSSATTVAPTFTADVEGTYVLSLTVDDGTEASAADEVTIIATTPNTAPVANAGPDQSVATGAVVTLDASGSSDADGDALTYAWTLTSKPGGSAAALSSATAVGPTFTADVEGTYVLSLTVHDGTVTSAADEITVTATTTVNVAPVASAGADRSVVVGTAVALDGRGSSDADGDTLTYAWTLTSKPVGSAAVLSSATAVAPTFTADLAGSYTVSLVVDDGALTSSADAVTIKAVAAAHVPDTGQTTSYTTTVGEDHDYTTNTPSFTGNGDGTVTDGVTGLVWQQADDGTSRAWAEAGTYCAGLSLPGSGWRLPTPWELLTITDFGASNPAFDTAAFSGAAVNYWAAMNGRTAATAWAADFYGGGLGTYNVTATTRVRCVRGAPLGAAFADTGNGTVIDAARNLTWQKADDGAKRTWEQAIAYCEGLTLGGSSDWRLPNIKELASLEDFSKYPVADLVAFPTAKENYYWSSTTVRTATTTAWQASFLGGAVGQPGLVKTNVDAYVRCVRGQ